MGKWSVIVNRVYRRVNFIEYQEENCSECDANLFHYYTGKYEAFKIIDTETVRNILKLEDAAKLPDGVICKSCFLDIKEVKV